MIAEPAAFSERELEAVVAAAAARCLCGAGSVDRDTPLSLLGLDSLRTLELGAELEDALGRPLPEDLLDGCDDIRALAARLHGICGGRADTTRGAREQMLMDAVLPADIRPRRQVRGATSLAKARTILLTGATGFLGAALAREILDRTGARLVCLARPAAGTSARARVRRQLSAAGVRADVLARRVRTVEADLCAPWLGLDPVTFARLADRIAASGAICHAGAAVNWACPYAGLRAANVSGTRELLRVACRAGVPFHFVSSLSVCYSTTAPRVVNESFDALASLAGVHLGYAQSKAVSEALVREAQRRGLPVRIYRPALISGDSRTGAFNRDDLISTLIRGCLHMGTAPDLDWTLDALPVDAAARAILELSGARQRVFHLGHPRPRHWRECVLWMRMYGYALRLVPYHAWLAQLAAETAPSAPDPRSHPLRALRAFFLARPAGERGLTLPELYEEGRRPRAQQRRTTRVLAAASWSSPPLDAALLETYFRAFIGAGDIPAPSHRAGRRSRHASLTLDAALFSRVTGLDVTAAHSLASGSDHSIVSELAGWRSGRKTGLFRFCLDIGAGGARHCRYVVAKLKPSDADIIETGESLAAICDPAIGTQYRRWRDRLGVLGAHERELAIYRQSDPRFVRHAPEVLGTFSSPERGTWMVVLEQIADAALMDSADRPDAWTSPRLSVAIDGLVDLHAIWLGRDRELAAAPWVGHVPTAQSMSEMAGLWEALAEHAAPAFAAWAGADVPPLHRRLARSAGRWWPALERGPRTLIHHDFNPRNICLRGAGRDRRLCAYDWELATIGAPQRDLAELLCFVLPPDVARDEVQIWIDRHRERLARATGRRFDAADWQCGFAAALADLLVNRLATYALIHRVRPQRFLPRLVRTWRRLHALFPVEEDR